MLNAFPTIELIIDSREIFADGMRFGDVGAYECLKGEARFGIDPRDQRNRCIVDLGHAPRNSTGLVEFSTDVFILKPVEMARGNRRLLYDVNNRGNKRALQFFNDSPPSFDPRTRTDAGNGFLMRRGYTIVWSGWQGDLLPVDGRLTIKLPVATRNGARITGTVRAEFIVEEPGIQSLPLSGNHYVKPYETASLDTRSARFTCRHREIDRREPVASTAWQFARLNAGGIAEPSGIDCYLPAGFRPGWIYELIYRAHNPLVLGLGFAGVRDLVAFLMSGEKDAAGRSNPLSEPHARIEKAYAWGRSQSGRFLREFVYRGFNAGENLRRVFDGVAAHVAGAGRLALNCRFGQPDRYPRQHEDHLYPSDQFPFAYYTAVDPHTGRNDAILKRPETDPRVIHTQTATEYWQRRGSLVHTDALGRDLPEHPGTRIYLLAGLQHNDAGAAPEGGKPRFAMNPVPANPVLRALLDALDDWVSREVAPPASRVPSRSGQTLCGIDAYHGQFPAIPTVSLPPHPNRLFVQNFGPDFESGMLAIEPPIEDRSREYAVMLPAVDSDGNELAGIPSPEVAVPLATHTGWNLRVDAEIIAGVAGSMIPFPPTDAARRSQNDPRPSIQERYASRSEYLGRLRAAAERLVAEGLYLTEDVERCIERAAKMWDELKG